MSQVKHFNAHNFSSLQVFKNILSSARGQRYFWLVKKENNQAKYTLIVIAITFYSPSCLGQETANGPFSL